MDPLRLTPYTEECIRNLSDNAECESDKILACLARLQIIVAQIPPNCGVQNPGSFTPIGLYVKALQAQLQAFRKDMPQELGQNRQLCPLPTSHSF
jgi:hypothetical protein